MLDVSTLEDDGTALYTRRTEDFPSAHRCGFPLVCWKSQDTRDDDVLSVVLYGWVGVSLFLPSFFWSHHCHDERQKERQKGF